ncbi:MAG: TIGR00730 family Rossman fold protein [Crocinitomicaceae bacterium]|nr:TIGR00730 family Rossman fold protein [Crocinitomicaceae bacterium]
MKRITVFCGARLGSDACYEQQATALGKALANQNIGLVYGGADLGLMGAVSNGALSENGEVIGVLPKFLQNREIAHKQLTELILVDSMHERKSKMNDLCDGIIALPGGIGTLEELFEIMTWVQLGLQNKPIGILNVNSYYASLIDLIDNMIGSGFLRAVDKELLIVSDNIEDLLDRMKNYVSPDIKNQMNNDLT